MTNNARDEEWSGWIDWSGGQCPLTNGTEYTVRLRGGLPMDIEDKPEELDWRHGDSDSDIIAYRHKIKEPESDMHPDLEWLARTLRKWPDGATYVVRDRTTGQIHCDKGTQYGTSWNQTQWQAARQQLGLDQPEVTEAEEEAWKDKERELNGKQLRYQDAKGEDWIDEFARTATVDEFRGAMRFTLGKYNRRAGKKDELIKEIEKMRDYCDRWISYEKELAQ